MAFAEPNRAPRRNSKAEQGGRRRPGVAADVDPVDPPASTHRHRRTGIAQRGTVLRGCPRRDVVRGREARRAPLHDGRRHVPAAMGVRRETTPQTEEPGRGTRVFADEATNAGRAPPTSTSTSTPLSASRSRLAPARHRRGDRDDLVRLSGTGTTTLTSGGAAVSPRGAPAPAPGPRRASAVADAIRHRGGASSASVLPVGPPGSPCVHEAPLRHLERCDEVDEQSRRRACQVVPLLGIASS